MNNNNVNQNSEVVNSDEYKKPSKLFIYPVFAGFLIGGFVLMFGSNIAKAFEQRDFSPSKIFNIEALNSENAAQKAERIKQEREAMFEAEKQKLFEQEYALHRELYSDKVAKKKALKSVERIMKARADERNKLYAKFKSLEDVEEYESNGFLQNPQPQNSFDIKPIDDNLDVPKVPIPPSNFAKGKVKNVMSFKGSLNRKSILNFELSKANEALRIAKQKNDQRAIKLAEGDIFALKKELKM